VTVLVAGGSGFIGSHLCEALLRSGHDVVAFDNLCTGRASNVEHLTDYPGFRLVEHDIVEALPPLPRISRIYHLASPASPPGYRRLQVETMRVNAEGTRRLLELAASQGARFLYASTSEAYGDPLEHPQREDYRGNVSSTGPRSMYDEAKRYGEALTFAYLRTRGVDARVVRIFNTYGPRSDPEDGRVVPNFFVQAMSGRPLTIYGEGTQTRSLCYVADTVRGLILAMETARARGEVINIGNPDERTILDYANIIAAVVGSNVETVHTEPAVGDDPQRRRPDITKARELLGWEPTVSLEDGLGETYQWFRRELAPQTRGAHG